MSTYYIFSEWSREPSPVEIDDEKLEAKRKSGGRLKVEVQTSYGRTRGMMFRPSECYSSKKEAWGYKVGRLLARVDAAKRNLASLETELAQAQSEREKA